MKVKEVIEKILPKTKVVKEKSEEIKCNNCTGAGEQCSSCSVPFEDTFGK